MDTWTCECGREHPAHHRLCFHCKDRDVFYAPPESELIRKRNLGLARMHDLSSRGFFQGSDQQRKVPVAAGGAG